MGIKIKSVDFSSWYNSCVDKLKSFNEEIQYLSDSLSSRMVFGCSLWIEGNFTLNTEGTIIYRGKTYRIQEQRLRKPKNGEYIYVSDIMAGTLDISSTRRDIAIARYVHGKFDYTVRDYNFTVGDTDNPVEGMMMFDQSKKCFAVYHSDQWHYERRSALVFSYNYTETYAAGNIGTFATKLPDGSVKLVMCLGFEHVDESPAEHVILKRNDVQILDCDLSLSSGRYSYAYADIESTEWSVYEIESSCELTITALSVSAIAGE